MLVTTTPQPTGSDGASALERLYLRAAGEALLQGRLQIFEMIRARGRPRARRMQYEIVAAARRATSAPRAMQRP